MPGREEQVPAGVLVYFHNHSQQGRPVVLLPATNANNAWTYHDRGYLVPDDAWLGTLTALLPEGFYVTDSHVHAPGRSLPARSLVQLGYNRQGEPILFAARRVGNTLDFPLRGMRFQDRGIFERLKPAGFVVSDTAAEAAERVLH
jgi:hypothetical protein